MNQYHQFGKKKLKKKNLIAVQMFREQKCWNSIWFYLEQIDFVFCFSLV